MGKIHIGGGSPITVKCGGEEFTIDYANKNPNLRVTKVDQEEKVVEVQFDDE